MPSATSHSRQRVLSIGLAVLLLGALVLAFSVPWKLNFLRGALSERVQAATGRAFAIDGDLWWHWGRRGRLVAEGLRFANPAWAGRPQMLAAQRVEAVVRLWPLLDGRVELPQVRVTQPDLWLETLASGQRNWYLDRGQSDAGTALQIEQVTLDQGRLAFVQEFRQTDVRVELQGRADRLQAQAAGRWHGLALTARAEGDGVLGLMEASRPYGLTVAGSVGRTEVSAAGHVTRLARPEAADLKVAVRGPTLGEWYRIAGIGLPETPPYRTAGRVRLQAGVWSYEDFTSRVGRSDLGGSVTLQRRPERPLIQGRLVSQRLDLHDLLPLVGKTPPSTTSTPPPQSRTERPRTPAPTGRSAGKVLPQQRLSAGKWDTLDADLQFDGRSVVNLGPMPLDSLKMHVVLQDRQLALAPFALGLAGGEVAGQLRIDGRAEPMQARIDARGRRLQLEQLVPRVGRDARAALGTLNGRIALAGQGDSFARLLGTANGEVQVAMGTGQISNLLLELIDLDAAEALGFLIRGDRPVSVRCALADVGFTRGVMKTRAVVFDTTDTIIEARGQADFAQERLDLRVTPVAKDASLLTLRVPFDVGGSFAAPTVSPDKARLLARGGGAVLLGLINPLTALIPLLELGPGEDSDCGQLVARARGEGVPVTNRPEAPAAAQNRK